mgnify:FL=1
MFNGPRHSDDKADMNPLNFTHLKNTLARAGLERIRAALMTKHYHLIFTPDSRERPARPDDPPPLASLSEVRLYRSTLKRWAGMAAAWTVIRAAGIMRATLAAFLQAQADDGTRITVENRTAKDPGNAFTIPADVGDTPPRAIRRAACDVAFDVCTQAGYSPDLVIGNGTDARRRLKDWSRNAAAAVIAQAVAQAETQAAPGAVLMLKAPECRPYFNRVLTESEPDSDGYILQEFDITITQDAGAAPLGNA